MVVEKISSLLFYGAGIKNRGQVTDWDTATRHYPSGGALYPLETYLIITKGGVGGVEPGVYHYNVKNHTLEKIASEKHLKEFYNGSDYFEFKPVTIILTAVWNRSIQKYDDFGYKAILLEAGHLMHNLQLVSVALSLHQFAYIGFDERKVDKLLDLSQRKEENSLYLLSLSNKP